MGNVEVSGLRPAEQITELVRGTPGLNTRQVARALDVDESTADYHLRRLRKEGRLACQEVGRELRWFHAGCGLCPVLKRTIPALRRPEVAAAAFALDETPRTARTIAQRAGIGLGAARWAAAVLTQAGVATKNPTGRVMLRDGAETCLAHARHETRCGLWGRCPVSRELEGEAVPV